MAPEFLPLREGKIDDEPALLDFETKQFAKLPQDYVLTRIGTQIMGARRKALQAPIALKWKPFPPNARIETPADEE